MADKCLNGLKCLNGWGPRGCTYTGGCYCDRPAGHEGRCRCDCGSTSEVGISIGTCRGCGYLRRLSVHGYCERCKPVKDFAATDGGRVAPTTAIVCQCGAAAYQRCPYDNDECGIPDAFGQQIVAYAADASTATVDRSSTDQAQRSEASPKDSS